MKTFKEFNEQLDESSEHLEKAHAAMMGGDYESALKHLSNHVPGKSRRRDAEVAKLALSIRSKLKKPQLKEGIDDIHPEVIKAYDEWHEYDKKNVNNTGPYQGHVIKKFKKFVAVSNKHGVDFNDIHQRIIRHELGSK